MVDITCVYHPKPPSGKRLLLYTRTARYTHLHIKVYRQEDIPKDIDQLNQWIRDRWTEKDKRVQQMKDKQIKYTKLNRSPYKAMQYYILWSFIFVYLIFNLMANMSFIALAILFISAVFPVIIVGIEYSQGSDV